jgi:hypothetical protein
MRPLRLCSVLLLACASTVLAQDKPATTPDEAPAAPAHSRVFRDPVTGQLRAPTPEEAAAIAQRAVGAAKSVVQQAVPTVSTRPDGSKLMRMNGSRRHYARATRSDDGKVALDCVDHPGAGHGQGEH